MSDRITVSAAFPARLVWSFTSSPRSAQGENNGTHTILTGGDPSYSDTLIMQNIPSRDRIDHGDDRWGVSNLGEWQTSLESHVFSVMCLPNDNYIPLVLLFLALVSRHMSTVSLRNDSRLLIIMENLCLCIYHCIRINPSLSRLYFITNCIESTYIAIL